jgi:hypothetical protein
MNLDEILRREFSVGKTNNIKTARDYDSRVGSLQNSLHDMNTMFISLTTRFV